MERIKYIDGIRGIAVIMVLFFHLNLYQQGFAGVEVFFVISGFIISTLLIGEYTKTGTIGLKNFYIRRVSRIYPPLMIVVFISIILFINFPISSLTDRFYQEALYTSFGGTNWYEVIHTTGYWENGVKSPLLHMWSIAIEIQFYLFWPLVMKKIMDIEVKSKCNLLVYFICSLSILFFILTFVSSYYYSFNYLYYSSHTRVVSFIVGGLFATINLRYKSKKSFEEKRVVFLLVTAIIVSYFFQLNSIWLFRYQILIFTTICGAFILTLGKVKPTNLIRKFFENPILLYLGKISYSFYLWHIPIIIFVTQKNIQQLTKISLNNETWIIIIQITFSFVLASLSNVLIEQRVHIRKGIPALIVIFGFPVITTILLNSTVNQHFKVINTQPEVPKKWQSSQPIITTGDTPLLVVGDSWSRRLAFGLDLAQQKENNRPYQLLLYGNGNASLMNPDYFLNSSGEKAYPFKSFAGYLEYWSDAINEYHPQKVLIVTGNADQSEMVINGKKMRVGSKEFEQHYLKQFNKIIHFFNEKNIKVYLTNIPNNAHSLAELSLNQSSTAMNNLLLKAIRQSKYNVTLLDIRSLLADGNKQVSPRLIDNNFIYDESNHPSYEGSLYIGKWLLEEVK